ncbi:MAG: SDR family NAD(P)-dependent oxidoreductase [Pseudomonadales bacterium]
MKSLLVTGAAKGIGAAIAEQAASAGYKVGVLDLDLEACQAVAAELENAVPLAANVCDPDSIARALAQFGAVDVLINNAGILRTGPLIDHDYAAFRHVMDVNLNAVFAVSQACARGMRDGDGGCIINLASINAIHPSPNCGAYAAAKAGVMGLTQHMSLEWGEFNIRVNAIAPGFIDAGMSSPFYDDAQVRERRAKAVPSGRLGTAADVAQTAMFLASDAASYINGQTLVVDGGVINSVLLHLPRE